MEPGRGGMSRCAKSLRLAPALATALLLAGCGWFSSDNVEEKATGKSAEKADVAATNDELVQPVTEQIGTPMAERVATLGFLNKRNGLTRDLELKPGQSIRIGRAIVRLRACERTAPWELTPEHGAFVQLLVNDRPATRSGDDKWRRVFSGWLFRESPSVNVVEHPIYDVWIKNCEMSFPGEEDRPSGADPTAPRSSSSNIANRASSSPNSAPEAVQDDDAPAPAAPPAVAAPAPSAPTPAPSPAPEPAPTPAPAPTEEGPEDLIGDLIAETE